MEIFVHLAIPSRSFAKQLNPEVLFGFLKGIFITLHIDDVHILSINQTKILKKTYIPGVENAFKALYSDSEYKR